MEVVPAARRHLMSYPSVRGYVQHRVFTYRLFEHVNGEGTRAIVCRLNAGWAEPDRSQSVEFPILVVDCWSDCTRNADGTKAAEDAIPNALALYRVVDPVLHRKRNMVWADGGSRGLLVVDIKRWIEPFYQTKDESHAGVAYGVELGDSAVVSVQYAMTVAH
jgi:hypothetical protein